MICHEHRIIFIDICKTAGTSVRSVVSGKGKHHTISNKYISRCLPKLTEEQINTYFKFTIIRNPYDRIVSLWLWGSKVGIYRDYSFHNFVKLIGNKKIKGDRAIRYLPMIDWLRNEKNQICIDYIGRFENLDHHFSVICEKMGIEPIKLPKKYTAEDLTGQKRKHYREYYNEETKKIIESIYEEDFRIFGYFF